MNRQIRINVLRTILAASLWMVGCGATQPPVSGAPEKSDPQLAQAQSAPAAPAKAKLTKKERQQGADVLPTDGKPPLPPIERSEVLMPHAADRLKRAKETLDQIVKSSEKPDYLKAADKDANDEPLPEPSLAAQRAYIIGRQALRERQVFEARRQLEMALSMAPDDPHLLRLMGRLWAATGNRSRSAFYLEKALAADPSDIQTLYMLGRHALDQNRWDVAIATFSHAKDNQQNIEADPALWSMIDYFLASALERRGNDQAMVKLMTAFLSGPDHASRSSEYGRQLMMLARQHGLLWQSVGDAHMRLNQVKHAIDAYTRAAQHDVDDLALSARRIYAELLLKDSEDAERILVEYLQNNDSSAEGYRLIRYVAAQGVVREQLAEQLQPIYARQERPSRLAIAIAGLLGPKEGGEFLRKHLIAKPNDQAVFEYLLKQQIEAAGGESLKGEAALAALRATIDAMSAAPNRSDDFTKTLTDAIDSPDELQNTLDKLDEATGKRREAQYIRAMALLQQVKVQEAEELLQQIIKEHPDYEAARIRLALVLVAREQFEAADTVLSPLSDRSDSTIISLRVAILSRTGRQEQALALLDKMLVDRPRDVNLIIQKASLQLQTDQANAAERTLLDALQTMPREERIYELLFRMYDAGRVTDSVEQYKRLMHRMLGNIPNSRLARLMLAEFQSARDFDQAERLLLSILEEDPNDMRALRQLLDMYRDANRADAAEKLINERLNVEPNNKALINVFVEYYVRSRNEPKQYEMLLRFLGLIDNPAERSRSLVMLHLSWYQHTKERDAVKAALDEANKALKNPIEDEHKVRLQQLRARALALSDRKREAEQVFKKLLKDFPDKAADITYFWAITVEHHEDKQRGERMMIDLLKKFPDHAQTQNGLGYMWANEGRNLMQAKKLIEAAVEAYPNQSAYLDSLGWVFYKLGDFDKAVEQLQASVKADHDNYPVILDHLGDAYYRQGEKDQASGVWRTALASLKRLEAAWFDRPDDPELEGLADRIQKKIDAVRKNQAPPLADVPQPIDKPQAQAEQAAE